MGPLMTTTEKHKYMIVATDYLTKWVEVRPLVSKDYKNIAQFFLDKVIMTHSMRVRGRRAAPYTR